jgi:hypothetical protein
VEVQAEIGAKGADGFDCGRENLGDVGVAVVDACEAVFCDDGDFEIGAVLFEEADGGSGEDAIPKGAEANNGNSAGAFEYVRLAGHGLIRSGVFVDAGFVDEHHGNFIADGVEAVAGDAAETAAIGLELYFGPAGRADQDFKKIGADCHVGNFSV